MIELKHLSKTFETTGGRVDALKDVSLTIPDGDVYGIIGMSGAGKSTLVRCINMLERGGRGHRERTTSGHDDPRATPCGAARDHDDLPALQPADAKKLPR